MKIILPYLILFIMANAVNMSASVNVYYMEEHVLLQGGGAELSGIFRNTGLPSVRLSVETGRDYKAEEISVLMARSGLSDFSVNGKTIRFYNAGESGPLDKKFQEKLNAAFPDTVWRDNPRIGGEGIIRSFESFRNQDGSIRVKAGLVVFVSGRGAYIEKEYILNPVRNDRVQPAEEMMKAPPAVYLTNVRSNLAEAVYYQGALRISVRVVLRRKIDEKRWLVENTMSGRSFQAVLPD